MQSKRKRVAGSILTYFGSQSGVRVAGSESYEGMGQQFNLIFGYHMDLQIIDSIQYSHKSIFEPLRFKFFLGGTPLDPPFLSVASLVSGPP